VSNFYPNHHNPSKGGKINMEKDKIKNESDKKLQTFINEFGKVLDPISFLKEKSPELCDVFLNLHELTLNDGSVSKKHKFLIHSAITAAQHDIKATLMHITGAIKAGATTQELLETAFTLIPVAGMPSFGVFLEAWKKVQEVK